MWGKALGYISKMCVKELCSQYLAKNGSWTAWGEWQSCDRECDGGVQMRSRDCLGRGKCKGNAMEIQTCNSSACNVDRDGGNTGLDPYSSVFVW